MSQQTSSKHQDILNTQLSAEETHKENSTLVKHEKIGKSPLTIVHQNDKWFIVLGNERLTEFFNTKEEALDELTYNSWTIVMHIAIIMTQKVLDFRKGNSHYETESL